MKLNSVLTLLFIALFTACKGGAYDLSGYGLKPDTGENASPLIAKALQEIAAEVNFDTVRILLPKGRYDFYPEGASKREYFISNHDQDNPKLVGLALKYEECEYLTDKVPNLFPWADASGFFGRFGELYIEEL